MVELRHYLTTPEGAVGIVTRRSNAQNDTRYWFKDHLGSIVAITGGAGVVKQRFTYDPWGKRTTAYNADPSAEERGFTGHEHLVEAGLIHMNGRLYFDALGRMLQADPIIQAPYDGQNYDRYAYVFNNPLSFIDPTGYSTWTRIRAPVAAIIVTIMSAGAMTAAAVAAGTSTTLATVTISAFGIEGATLSITGAMIAGAAGGFAAGGLSSGNIEGALQGALQGAAFGALNFGIGNITTGAGNVFGEYAKAANVALHAVVGCAQSAAAGGSCKGGAASGGFSAAAGAVGLGGGVVGRAVVGAMASKLAGGRAGDGAMVAAFDYLFNEVAHCPRKDQCMKFAGYEPTNYTRDGVVCNSSGVAGCSAPGGFSRIPDAWSIEAQYLVGSFSLAVTRDGDIFFGGGFTRTYPTNGKFGFSLNEQYIDGGEFLLAGERSAIVGGRQHGVSGCFYLCVGRSYSTTIGAAPVGVMFYGIGTPGASYTPISYSFRLIESTKTP